MRRLFPAIPILALALLAAGLLIAPALDAPQPKAADWEALARLLRPELRPGDVLRIEPVWASAGRLTLGQLGGVDAPTPFAFLDLQDPPDPWWLAGRGRVILVKSLGRGGATELALEEFGFLVTRRLQASGGLSVSFLELEPSRALLWRAWDNPPPGSRRQDRAAGGSVRQCLVPQVSSPEGFELLWTTPLPAGRLRLVAGHTLDSARLGKTGAATLDLDCGSQTLSLTVPARDYLLHERVVQVTAPCLPRIRVRPAPGAPPAELCLDAFLAGN